MKFLTKGGVKATEIHQPLVNVYGPAASSFSTVSEWSSLFRQGRESPEDIHRSGRLNEATGEDTVKRVENLTEENPRYGKKETAPVLNISRTGALAVLHEKLDTNKIGCRWAPRRFTFQNKRERMASAEESL